MLQNRFFSNSVHAAEVCIFFEHPMQSKRSPLIFFEYTSQLSVVFDPLDTSLTVVLPRLKPIENENKLFNNFITTIGLMIGEMK